MSEQPFQAFEFGGILLGGKFELAFDDPKNVHCDAAVKGGMAFQVRQHALVQEIVNGSE